MLDLERIPKHVALIMDGNGRWAKEHGVPRVSGHNAGMWAMKEILKDADRLGIKYLTVYAFSTENWKRTQEEIGGIFGLLVKFVASELKEINDNNVKINILGDYSAIPETAKKAVDKALETTKENDGINFNIALNYGSRDEITRAVRAIVKEGIDEEKITESTISEHLYTSGMPDPELMIRTSGELRLSNYLLWQLAYSEFVFTDCYWPDFTPDEFRKCIEEYQSRDRRFGGRK